jgi:hypothetical protein
MKAAAAGTAAKGGGPGTRFCGLALTSATPGDLVLPETPHGPAGTPAH